MMAYGSSTPLTCTSHHCGESAVTEGCHYCREACETDLLSGEPVFQCVWCQAVAHVRCHQDTHPVEDSKVPSC